jgi:hypothetical protein
MKMVEFGIHYVRLGLETAGLEPRRLLGLEVLWWQLLICHLTLGHFSNATVRRNSTVSWKKLNKQNGLMGFDESIDAKIDAAVEMISSSLQLEVTERISRSDFFNESRETPEDRGTAVIPMNRQNAQGIFRRLILGLEKELLRHEGMPLN